MPERYLVLGASSFYGRNFCALVKERGGEVIERRHYAEEDVECDYVVNFASMSLVAESWDKPWEWFDANASAFSRLLHRCKGWGIKKFVHVSTPEVYGHHQQPWKPGLCFRPTTPYAASRAAGDMMLLAYHQAYGFPAVITRTANIYGPSQPDYRFIPHTIKSLKSGKRVALHGGGKTVRGWIHVRDAVEALYRIAKEGIAGETYHIAPKTVQSVAYVGSMICELLDKTPGEWLYSVEDRLGKDLCYWLDAAETRSVFKWKPTISLEEGLKECVLSISQ